MSLTALHTGCLSLNYAPKMALEPRILVPSPSLTPGFPGVTLSPALHEAVLEACSESPRWQLRGTALRQEGGASERTNTEAGEREKPTPLSVPHAPPSPC